MSLVRPTGRGRVFALASLCALLAALVNINLTTSLAASAMLGILGASFLLSFFSLYRVRVSRCAARDGVAGAVVSLPVIVTNLGMRRRQTIIIREICPFSRGKTLNVAVDPLLPGESRFIERTVVALRRGMHNLERIDLIGGDPAGLFYCVKSFRQPAAIMIFPEIVKLSHMPVRIRRELQMSLFGRALGISGIGQDFFGVREYRPGDGFRSIHWKASAKQRRLMVRELEAHSPVHVSVILDTHAESVGMDPYDNNFEYLVRTAASIVWHLSELYCRLSFIASPGGGHVSRIFGEAVGVKNKIIESLAVLEPSDMGPGALLEHEADCFRPNSILYCLTMSETPAVRDCLDSLRDRGVSVRWICAPAKNFPAFQRPSPGGADSFPQDVWGADTAAPCVVGPGMSIARLLSYG